LDQTTPVHRIKQYYVADHDKNERDQKHYDEQVVQHHLKQTRNRQYTRNLHRTETTLVAETEHVKFYLLKQNR